MLFHLLNFLLVAVCILLLVLGDYNRVYGYSSKGRNANRIVSKTPRILAQMYGKAFAITRKGENGYFFYEDSRSPSYEWLSFPNDDVKIEVRFGKRKHKVGTTSQFQLESVVYAESLNSEYRVRNETLQQIRKLDASFECLMKILTFEILNVDSNHGRIRNYNYRYSTSASYYYSNFYIKLQRIIEIYELLEHASSYQENNVNGALFHLTDPEFVVQYCRKSGYI